MLEYPEVQRRQFLLALENALEQADSNTVGLGLLLVDITNLGRINQSRQVMFGVM